jgi:hypothetical protein
MRVFSFLFKFWEGSGWEMGFKGKGGSGRKCALGFLVAPLALFFGFHVHDLWQLNERAF